MEEDRIRDFWRNLGRNQSMGSDTRVATRAGRCHCEDVLYHRQKSYWERSVTNGKRKTLQLSSKKANRSICGTTDQSGSLSYLGKSWGKSSWNIFLVTEEKWWLWVSINCSWLSQRSFLGEITRSVDEQGITGVIYFDFRKTFYTMSLSIVGVLNWDVLVWMNVCLHG